MHEFEARRNFGGDPGQQMRHVGRDGQGEVGCDAALLAATAFVEDRNPRLETVAVLGEGTARHEPVKTRCAVSVRRVNVSAARLAHRAQNWRQ